MKIIINRNIAWTGGTAVVGCLLLGTFLLSKYYIISEFDNRISPKSTEFIGTRSANKRDSTGKTNLKSPDDRLNPGLHHNAESIFENELRTIDPDTARELIVRCKKEMTDIDGRSRRISRIISALCNNGYTKEAWKLIDPDPGDVRSKELLAFFENPSLVFSERITYREGLTDPMDRAWALSGLINVPAERMNEIDFSNIHVVSAQEKNTIGSHIALSMSGLSSIGLKIPDAPERARELLDTSADLVRAGKLDFPQLSRILQSDLSNDGFYHWDFIDKIKAVLPQNEFEDLQASIVPGMIRNDSTKAMDAILSDPTAMRSGRVISSAIESWYRSDSRGANDWMTAHATDPEGVTKDLILASVARVASKDGDFPTALKWTGAMSNPQFREKVETLVNAMKDKKD